MTATFLRMVRRPFRGARAAAGAPVLALAVLIVMLVCADAAPAARGGALPASWLGVPGEAFALGSVPRSGSFGASACAPAWGSFRVGNWPSACWRPYGPASPFNFAIPPNPRISGESTAIVGYMTAHHWAFDSAETEKFIWDAGGSRPVYWSASSDPLVRVICRGGCRAPARLFIPAGAQPEEGSDGPLTVVDQRAGREYDFWQATKPENEQMTVSAASSIPIGPESGTGLEGDAEAARLGLLGGLIRAAELSSGRIEHALVTTVKCVQKQDVWPSPSWGEGDAICANAGSGPRFASLLQLNMSEAEIAATHAPSWEQTIMTALARYGVYVVDTQSTAEMSLLSEDDLSFTSFGYTGQMAAFIKSHGGTSQLVGVPIQTSKLRVIDPCVPQGTC